MAPTGGIDPTRTSAWLAERVPDAVAPFRFDLIAGGRSNLTFEVRDDTGRRWALRRPPTGGVLDTAHDMEREWRFISALAGTAVPVPEPVAYCADASVTGAPFYVMGFVDAVVLADPESGAHLDGEARVTVADSTIDVLAALHQLDPDAVGLGGFRRPGNAVERQLRRWHRQVHLSAVEDLRVLDEVHRRLSESIPPTGTSITHGDFRPGNISYRADGSAAAVFDWELASIGEPMIDLAWLLTTWTQPGDRWPATTEGPTGDGGYPSREHLIDRYRRRRGHELPHLPYYLAFARWRAACIVAGVYTRYHNGDMGEDGYDYSGQLNRVSDQAEAALALLSEPVAS